MCMKPLNAWAIVSNPTLWLSGLLRRPKAEIDAMISRGLISRRESQSRPRFSSTPGP